MSNTVIPIDDGNDATDMSSTTHFTLDSNRSKRKRNLSKETNVQRVELKVIAEERKKRQDESLCAAVVLMDYTDTIEYKVRINRKSIEQEVSRSPYCVQPTKIRAILREVNTALLSEDKPISKTTLLRYHKIGLDKRCAIYTPPKKSMKILNCMRLHIRAQQVSNQGKASGGGDKG